ncbi:MAG TPA: heparinase II/III family protein [Phenylobacterium sp.]|nr:heparinase II/III family protein [Phenylobacterium sp.]
MPGPVMDRIPGGYRAMAVAVAARRTLSGAASTMLAPFAPRATGLAATPHDLRPADPENGRRILAGAFVLGGETLAHGARGDPWDRASPSRGFALGLHRFGWMGDLLAQGEPGAREGLRLALGWRRVFGRATGFSWTVEVLERRVYNLACAAKALSAGASDAEAAQIARDLTRQAHALLATDRGPVRAAERAAAAAVAGAALAGEGLLKVALQRLERALPQSVDPDGGHATRSPQAALELFYDLLTLDDALTQRGAAAPPEMSRALEGLTGAVRFFTLADGGLAAFQGGETLSRAYVAGARAQDLSGTGPTAAKCNGYHRLGTRGLQVVADAAAPAAGAWSVAACGQPLAVEILAAGRRLIVGSGLSGETQAAPALRLADAASTLTLGDQPCGQPLDGYAAQVLGPRLRDAHEVTLARRQDAPGAHFLEMAHDGWARRLGLRHERRLYLDLQAEELRGEDRLTPLRAGGSPEGRRFVPFAIRFHLHPQVSALIALDGKSVLLKADDLGAGWSLRSDAPETVLEPSTYYQNDRPRRSQQVVLRGQARLDAGARVRWKLSAAGSRVDAAPAPA